MKLLHPTVLRSNDKLKQNKPQNHPVWMPIVLFQNLQQSEPSACCISLQLKLSLAST